MILDETCSCRLCNDECKFHANFFIFFTRDKVTFFWYNSEKHKTCVNSAK